MGTLVERSVYDVVISLAATCSIEPEAIERAIVEHLEKLSSDPALLQYESTCSDTTGELFAVYSDRTKGEIIVRLLNEPTDEEQDNTWEPLS